MKKRILTKVLIALAILIGIPALPIYSSEYKLSKCPVDKPFGSQFIWDGPDQWKVIIGKRKFLENPLNNESLAEEMGLLKLHVIESLHLFFVPEETVVDKITWNRMKPYLVSMEVIGECVDESGIYFAGRWNSKSFDRARKIVAYEKAFEELVTLYSEHEDIFVDDVVSQEKVYRGIEECDDAKCLEKIIKTLKKTIGRN